MITAEQYTLFTGAEAPDNFDDVLALVQADIEQVLGRKLASAERTETLPHYQDGLVYPTATPVTLCDLDFDSLTILVGRTAAPGKAEVTYTGGWEQYGEEENPLPALLAQALAWGVHTFYSPTTQPAPAGVTSLSVGDYSVGFAAGYGMGADGQPVPPTMTAAAHLGGRACTLAAPFRKVK